jgi:hypothetical protein
MTEGRNRGISVWKMVELLINCMVIVKALEGSDMTWTAGTVLTVGGERSRCGLDSSCDRQVKCLLSIDIVMSVMFTENCRRNYIQSCLPRCTVRTFNS